MGWGCHVTWQAPCPAWSLELPTSSAARAPSTPRTQRRLSSAAGAAPAAAYARGNSNRPHARKAMVVACSRMERGVRTKDAARRCSALSPGCGDSGEAGGHSPRENSVSGGPPHRGTWEQAGREAASAVREQRHAAAGRSGVASSRLLALLPAPAPPPRCCAPSPAHNRVGQVAVAPPGHRVGRGLRQPAAALRVVEAPGEPQGLRWWCGAAAGEVEGSERCRDARRCSGAWMHCWPAWHAAACMAIPTPSHLGILRKDPREGGRGRRGRLGSIAFGAGRRRRCSSEADVFQR